MAKQATGRTHVTFKTGRFNQTEVRPHFINDCCFGEDCAAFLVGSLRSSGWPEITDAWQEDWGWQATGERGHRKYLISVGLIPEDDPEWLVHVQEHTGFLARLKGQVGPSALPELTQTIHAVLESATDVRDIRWHFEDVFMKGQSTGHASPSAPRSSSEVAV